MPTPDGPQFKKLLTGTGGAIEGGAINPTDAPAGRGAYATDIDETADAYAKRAAKIQGRLFGTVHSVEPMGDGDWLHDRGQGWKKEREGSAGIYRDPVGLKGVKVERFVNNDFDYRGIPDPGVEEKDGYAVRSAPDNPKPKNNGNLPPGGESGIVG